ncbi:helix-turn-helix transcriptional regulator [Pseudomonas sp. Teo4]|uniref:helix-turn-helix domain-containing protein n=1 Tax=Pseudomonas sp. Teo4 TaxID=3064528 RepID=UPI002ACB0CE0|nr:helix-turn-helix transcriptional regulator [Pseudomonas sp. Teo4]
MATSSLFEDVALLKQALAAVVRALRESLGFTQENLAHAASRTYLSRIENADSNPTIEKFAELAEALGLSLCRSWRSLYRHATRPPPPMSSRLRPKNGGA